MRQIHEVEFVARNGWLVVLFPAAFFGAMLISLVGMTSLGGLWWAALGPIFAMVLILGTFWFWYAAWRRRLRQVNDISPIDKRLEAALEGDPSRPAFVAALVSQLTQLPPDAAFPTGDALRLGSNLKPITPWEKPVEPVALDRRDAGFVALNEEQPSSSRAVGEWLGLLLPCAFMLWAAWIVPVWWLRAFFLLMMGAAIAAFFGLRWSAPRYFAVPGALVIRGKENLIYRATECRLLVIQHAGAHLVYLLRPDGVTDNLQLGEAEANMLLSLWVSPVPTPEASQLVDFA